MPYNVDLIERDDNEFFSLMYGRARCDICRTRPHTEKLFSDGGSVAYACADAACIREAVQRWPERVTGPHTPRVIDGVWVRPPWPRGWPDTAIEEEAR